MKYYTTQDSGIVQTVDWSQTKSYTVHEYETFKKKPVVPEPSTYGMIFVPLMILLIFFYKKRRVT